ncbi:MAG: energy transducer TonB [Sulfurimonas sp.]|nr:energy transducer TonB [Sulfurimonas sp.]
MYLSLKAKKTSKEHKFLLLISALVVTSALYALLQGYNYITLSNEVQRKVIEKEKTLVFKINPAPIKKEVIKEEVVKKEKVIEKPKKKPKTINKEIVKKEVIKDETIKDEVVKENVEEIVLKEIVQEVEQVEKPIFDEKAKESFIAGLYEVLNENKRYPKMAKRRKLEGVCEVSFTLSKDGKIKDVFLKKACGHSILDTAALKVVRSVEFYKPIPDSVSLTSLHLNIPIKYARN